jgi:tRNA threonylcarbamoyl adenosine modification protein (Sua5/YciO/YrdC/YwlC family)
VDVIRQGGLVGFPTETVYGVGVRADCGDAVAALRRAKGREDSKPFTVHIGQPEDVDRFVPEVSPLARRFIRKGWPGPLTLVLPVADPAKAQVIRESGEELIGLMYHEGTLGIRCPDDTRASDLLAESGLPVVAASANLAGEAPPRNAEDLLAGMEGLIDLVLDGGETRYSAPSTVVKLNGAGYEVLREGVINKRMLKRLGATHILFVCSGNTCRSPMAAGLCRRALAEMLGCPEAELRKRGIYVQSAGAMGTDGMAASNEAVRAMAARSVDLSMHVSRKLDLEAANQADYVFCMTRSHVDAVLALSPAAANKTMLLGGDTEITDPFGGSVEGYVACADTIEAALKLRLSEIHL